MPDDMDLNANVYVECELEVKNRDERMPRVLECRNHPLVHGIPYVRRVLVMLVKTDWTSMQDAYKYERTLDVPDGSEDAWANNGLIKLESGDYVFMRDLRDQEKCADASILASEDVLAVSVTGREHHSTETLKQADKAIERIVGTGEGGLTELERTKCAKKVKNSRCYSLATTVEPLTNLCAPAAASKQRKENETYNKIAQDAVFAGSDMVVEISRVLPAGVRDAIRANWEQVNHPTAGSVENFMGPNVQLNISTVPKKGDEDAKGLKGDLGQFGKPHFDLKDHHAYLTVMLALHRMSASCDPGHFHILQLGVYTSLAKYRGVIFSGRRKHAGTSTSSRNTDEDTEDNNFRINLVYYPTKHCVDGSARFVFGSGAGKPPVAGSQATDGSEIKYARSKAGKEKKGKATKKNAKGDQNIFCITPEMQNINNNMTVDSLTNRATFAVEGEGIMERRAQANWLGRGGLQAFTWLLRQAGGNISFSVDQEMFMKSMTFLNSEGEREQLDGWPCAPNVEDVRPARVEASRRFRKFADRVGKFIPSVAAGGRGKVATGDDSDSEEDAVDEEIALEAHEKTINLKRNPTFLPFTVGDEAEHALDMMSLDGGDEEGESDLMSLSRGEEEEGESDLMLFSRGNEEEGESESLLPFSRGDEEEGELDSMLPFSRGDEEGGGSGSMLLSREDEEEGEWCSTLTFSRGDEEEGELGSMLPFSRGVEEEGELDSMLPFSRGDEEEGELDLMPFSRGDEEEGELGSTLPFSRGDEEDGESDLMAFSRGHDGDGGKSHPMPFNGEYDNKRTSHLMPLGNIGGASALTTAVAPGGSGLSVLEESDSTQANDAEVLSPSKDSVTYLSIETRTDGISTTDAVVANKPSGKRCRGREYQGEKLKRQRRSFKLLDKLVPAALMADISRLEGELGACTAMESVLGDEARAEVFQQLSASFSMLESEPISFNSPKYAKSIHDLAIKCEGSIQRNQLITRVRRSQVMLSLSKARRWVEIDVVRAAMDKLKEESGVRDGRTHDWLDDIIGILLTGLSNGAKTVSMDPTMYPRLKAFGDDPFVIANSHAPHKYIGAGDRDHLHDAVVDAIRTALPQWLGFAEGDAKEDRNDRVRAWVVDVFRDTLGTVFLTTDIAWSMISNFKVGHVIHSDRVHRSATPSYQLLKPFINALKAHPTCDPTTEMGALWNRYRSIISTKGISKPTLLELRYQHSDRLSPFISYIQLGWEALEGNAHLGVDNYSSSVFVNLDKHWPFREHAYERMRSRGPSGPYEPRFLKTRAGIFSAMVWRGVTEGTLFTQNWNMQFHSIEDFRAAIHHFTTLYPEQATHASAFCQQDIHGKFLQGRDVSVAETLWEDTNSLGWEEFCDTYPSFGDCFTYFFSRPSDSNTRRVREVDTVSMFNLVCDLAYAGICQPPGTQEMAQYISTVKGHSYHALRSLGFLNNSNNMEDGVLHAISGVIHRVIEHFTSAELGKMTMDIMGIEYALGRYYDKLQKAGDKLI
ncbi:hypothetical protein EST38_g9678 [Candolleomyces aberdarensis]|uniref:Uncharacterized protein n=1 Tax=Candolleomyces aberdarensis TaxID=2316362 RepID=A0A4V1Q2T2_9AGAR|nr:hypothetical protein EST38_g9678 [Candolleomyces aberdarensis]